MKSLLIVVLSCVACNARVERKCDVVIEDTCINKGEYELSDEDIEYVVDVTYYHYSTVYSVEFNLFSLSRREDLYVMFTSNEEVTEYCGNKTNGCYIDGIEEIRVGRDIDRVVMEDGPLKEKGLNLQTLSHELLHFWNRHYLKGVQPGLFGSDFDEAEAKHSVPGMFGIGNKGSVEAKVWKDIQDYISWKYGE